MLTYLFILGKPAVITVGFLFVLFAPKRYKYFRGVISINLHQPLKLDVTISFPEKWDELLPSEILEISKLQLLYPTDIGQQKAMLLVYMLKERARVQKIKIGRNWTDLLDTEQAVLDGFPLLEFIYGENNLMHTAEDVIRIPGILPGFTKAVFYGPKEGFQHLVCGEYEDAETHFNLFYEDPDGKHLAALAAVLWRPKNTPYISLKKGKMETYDAKKAAHFFEKLEPWRLYAIFMWYCGCRNQMPKLFPTVHEGDGNSGKLDIMAFTKCIHAGAGPKNGSRNDIRMMKLFEFFFDMEQEAVKAKEMTIDN